MRHTERKLAEGSALVEKGCVRLQSIGNRLGARGKRRGYHKRNEDAWREISIGRVNKHNIAMHSTQGW